MKKEKTLYLGGILCLLLLAGIVRGIDEPVSSWPQNQTYPTISGKYVVWEDYYSGSHYDIYMFNLETRSERSICTTSANQRFPDIDENIIVWQDDRNGNWDIYGYDLGSNQELEICTNTSSQTNPRVSGHLVVWEDQRFGNYDIMGYNLQTQKEFKVCTSAGNQQYPDVSVAGSYPPFVVWQDYRNGNWDIYSLNLGTGTEAAVETQADAQQRPRIDMPRVVWQDSRGSDDDIYMYTFYSMPPITSIITSEAGDQRYPAISGRNIVWQDFRNGTGDIYGGRLGVVVGTWQICTDSAVQAYPAVSDNYVVWHDYRNGATKDYDIYGGAIGADSWHTCSTLLDFEFVHEYSPPEWDKISTHYEGVEFSAGGVCSGSDDTVIIANLSAVGTASGQCAVGNYGCEFTDAHLEMIFDNPQEIVTFFVGSTCGTYTITAYDDQTAGNVVYSETFALSCDLTEHGVFRYVEVTSEAENILRIELDNDWGIHIYVDDLEFDIDNTPPVARIDHPSFEECTCGIFPIEGEACDEDGGQVEYTVLYQSVGAAPDDWTEIYSGQGQICGSGILTEWDTSALAHNRYYVKLIVTNECGMTATDTTIAFVDKTYNTVEIRYPDNYDGVHGVIRGNSVCIDGTVWDYLCYDSEDGYVVEYKPLGSGSWQPVLPGPIDTDYVLNDPYARWDTTALADGDYQLRVRAIDKCGNEASDTVTPRIDNTAPIAEITSLENCTYVTLGSGYIPILGTAYDVNINTWTLEYTGGMSNIWVPINNGTSNVIDGLLGEWNTTGLPPCSYTLRLRVWDQALWNCTGENRNYDEFTVSVKIGADLNGDGCVNLLDFALFADEWLTGCP